MKVRSVLKWAEVFMNAELQGNHLSLAMKQPFFDQIYGPDLAEIIRETDRLASKWL